MALRNAILLGLENPMVYQKNLEENQDTHMQTGSSRLLQTCRILIAKESLCRLSAQQWQQAQPARVNLGSQATCTRMPTRRLQIRKGEQGWNEAVRLLLLWSQASSSSKGHTMSKPWYKGLHQMYCKSKKATPGKHRHNQLTKIAGLQSTHIQVPTCHLSHPSST